jgi:hypothetical protein
MRFGEGLNHSFQAPSETLKKRADGKPVAAGSEQTPWLPIVPSASLAALGADRPALARRFNINDQGFHPGNEHDLDRTVNKRLESFDLVQ